MITEMTKYTFILLTEECEGFLEKLREYGVVDITRSKRPVDTTSSGLLDKSKEMNRIISVLRKVDYGKSEDAEAISGKAASLQLGEDTIQIAEDTLSAIEKLENELGALSREMKSRLLWGDFDPESLSRLESAGYRIRFYAVPQKKFDREWENNYPLQIINEEGGNVHFVTVAPVEGEYDFPVEETDAPAGSWKESAAEIDRIKTEIITRKATLLCLKDRISELEEKRKELLLELDMYLASVSVTTTAEDRISIFEGFAPVADEAQLCAEFDQMNLAYIKEEATEEDNPPIKLKNNRFASMFEVLTGMYGMPLYSEFDPTPVLAPFFLLFFSMCMGDAGYGIILFILGFLLKKGSGSMAKLGPLVTTLGIGTFFVGIVLGTFFGINLAESSWVPQWLKSVMITGEIAGYSSQMVLALGIGIFHICLAMTIKAIGYTKRFGFKQTISSWAWLILIVGGICIAGLAMLGVMDENVTKWAVITIGIISGLGIYIFNDPGRNPLINIGSGLWDTYNMATGLLGDVLSYLRLYALGLAGGMLGNAFNNLAGMILDGIPVPGLNWIGFALILVLGHALNLAMSCLGAFVHPLRLTFVEYFKNSGYEGKGKGYNPLTLDKSINE